MGCRVIKYLEDPVVSDKTLKMLKTLKMSKMSKRLKSHLSVASDFVDYRDYSYRVLKPSGFCHSISNKLNKPMVVTSYFDHPLGQIIAAEFAKKYNVKEPCGLMTHMFFEKNKYSELFSQRGDFQFEDYSEFFKLLNREKWRELL